MRVETEESQRSLQVSRGHLMVTKKIYTDRHINFIDRGEEGLRKANRFLKKKEKTDERNDRGVKKWARSPGA